MTTARDADELLNQTQLARALGISRPAIRDWIQSGQLSPVRGKKYSLQQARALMHSGEGNRADANAAGDDPLRSEAARAARAAAGGRRAPEQPELDAEWVHAQQLRDPGDLALMRARARYAREAIGALREAGKLVEAKRVGDYMRSYIKEMRERVRSLPDHWASRFAAELGVPPAKMTELMREMSGETLREIENANLAERFDQEIVEDD